ncbi:MAG: RIP metalloprotease RseP, partial [Chlamydiae bacterium]|nr:RIP metalloprotease RseP [Chlamydiota bacterium]
MKMSLAYLVLAALGLGILVFIHELGHYFMAKREGMKIEVFSIGFGKPIFSWKS